jgi:hypothetical protein
MPWSHLIAAAAAALAAWLVQDWRLGEQIAQLQTAAAEQRAQAAEDLTEQVRHVLKAERSQHARVAQAERAARAREVLLRDAAAAARAERDSVRDASAAAVRTAQESAAACPERAAALGAVFDQCTARYEALAQRADRHASDVRTLIEAWPADVPRLADSPPPQQSE